MMRPADLPHNNVNYECDDEQSSANKKNRHIVISALAISMFPTLFSRTRTFRKLNVDRLSRPQSFAIIICHLAMTCGALQVKSKPRLHIYGPVKITDIALLQV